MKTLEDLKAIAKTAMPGAWHNDRYRRTIRSALFFNNFNVFKYPTRTDKSPISHQEWEGNADFVATFNPELVSALLDEVMALRHGYNTADWSRIEPAMERTDALIGRE